MVNPPDSLLANYDRGLRRQLIVRSILADVFQGRLRPGQHLTTQELSQRFGVSHTPIREALIELGGVGIIDLLPNRGAIVRKVTTKDVREICQVRRILECAATRSACGQIDLCQLNELKDEFRRLMATENQNNDLFIEQARLLDSRLHDLIAISSGNNFLANELTRLKTLFRAFRDVAWELDQARNDYRRLAEECHEHLAIVEALLRNDPKTASTAMANHIRSGLKYWSRVLPEEQQKLSSSESRTPPRTKGKSE